MPTAKPTRTVYMCSWCGKTEIRSASMGRPQPGNCPRKAKDRNGNFKPHTWVISKKM